MLNDVILTGPSTFISELLGTCSVDKYIKEIDEYKNKLTALQYINDNYYQDGDRLVNLIDAM